jgi:hypothetical protein
MNNNTGPNLILVKTALDQLLNQALLKEARVGKATALDAQVFTQGTADNAAKVSSVIGGGGYFDETLNDVSINNSITVNANAPRVTQMVNFKQDIEVSRTFMADQQQDAVSKSIGQQAMAWTASRDRNAFSVYANGFTTQTTIDGVPLFSNSHVNLNGDTVDNLETGSLTDPNLNIVINSLRTQLSQTGVLLGYEPDFLLVPSILHRTGMAITKSVLRAGTGNNDLNYFSEMYPGMKCVYNPFLDATSQTAYFVGSTGHGVMRFEREALKTYFVDWETSVNDSYVYKMRAREATDSIEYSGLVGSTGLTA